MGGAISIKEWNIPQMPSLIPPRLPSTIFCHQIFMNHQEMNFISKLFGKLYISEEKKEVDEEMPEQTNEPICPTSPRRYLEAEGKYCGAKQLTICEDCIQAEKSTERRSFSVRVNYSFIDRRTINNFLKFLGISALSSLH